MRIAIVQTMYPDGHRTLDKAFVRVLSHEHHLFIVDDGKYFEKDIEDLPNVERISVTQFSVRRWEAFKRCLRRLNLLLVFLSLWLKKKDYELILFLNIDNDIYHIERWLPKKKRVLIHHNDIDVLFADKQYYKSFEIAKDKFFHICLADYISDSFAYNAGVDKNKVFTVHQPLVFNHEILVFNNKKNLIVGIGNSLDECFVEDVIKLDQEETVSTHINHLILRSKSHKYQSEWLEVINGFLPRNEYERLYDEAKVSVVLYPQHYRYRYSGVIDDSLSKGLIVFSNDSLCGRYFKSVYPKSVFIIEDAKELWKWMNQELPCQDKTDHALFIERHSDAFVLNQFNAALNT